MTTTHSGDSTVPGGLGVHRLHETVTGSDRDALWAALRERHGSVAPVELENGARAWLVLGYHENLTVLRDQRLFSRDTRRWREVIEGRVDLAAARPTLSWRPNALYADGPEHTRLRSAIADSLARVDLNATARTVRRIAGDLIDSFAPRGGADLISEYAHPLPVLVVNSLYGLPDDYGHMLGGLTAIAFSEDPERAGGAVVRLHQYFSELVRRKHRKPGPDLVSWMIEHPSGLSDSQVAHQAALINNASHMATTHLIGNTMHTLLTDKEVRVAYADARLPIQELLDHVMWTDAPSQILPARIALQDTHLGETPIRAGDALLIGFGGAHRDPSVRCGRGETIGISSGSRAHLMFGAGAHSCPARELARMTASIAVTTLRERLGGIRLAVDPQDLRWVRSPFVRGLSELPVTFTPGEPQAPPRGKHADPTGPGAEETHGIPESEDVDSPDGDLLGRLLSWWRGLRSP